MMTTLFKRHTGIVICVTMVMAIFAVYWQVRGYGFVSFDDGLYVYENAHVRSGISMQNVIWAFGFTGIAYYHPLTWLSHMLDSQLFGLNAGRHHLVNVILHTCNSLLLFVIFRRMTGQAWKSAFIAFLFALHPLNVESVAWVSERKNVLSTFFWMMTLLSYSFYVKRNCVSRYLLTLILFMLGLLAKPAIVTLPFVMLLLDYWPLNRFRIEAIAIQKQRLSWSDIKIWFKESNVVRLIIEKIPFFLMIGGSIYVSYLSTRHHGIVVPAHEVPFDLRLANGLVSYMGYLGKIFWPQKLAVFYPYPSVIPLWWATVALIWIICVTLIVLRWAYHLPYLVVGWFWYLGILVPYNGLIQAGLWPALADRWAYIPSVGIFIMIAWGIPRLTADWRFRKLGLPLGSLILLLILMPVTWTQIGYWKNNITLYRHTVNVTPGNGIIHNNLGAAYFDAGNVKRAVYHFVETLKIRPGDSAAHRNLNKALAAGKNEHNAIERMLELLKIYPGTPALHYNLGNLYRGSGQTDNAMAQYRMALQFKPDFIHAINNQAAIYIVRADYSKAIALLKQIAVLQPNDPGICLDIARVYARQGRARESVEWLEKAVEKGFPDRESLRKDRYLKQLDGTSAFQNFLLKIQ